MATQADLGKKALGASNFEEAIKQYTLAPKVSPTSPDYLIQRATAYQRAQKYDRALEDANQAVLHAQKRAKRELIIESQFRRGCALYTLGRYGDAEFVLGVVKRMKGDHKMADMWINKTQMASKGLPEDDVKRQCTVTEKPDVDGDAVTELRTVSEVSAASGTDAVVDGASDVAEDGASHTANAGSTITTDTMSSISALTPVSSAVTPQQTPADKIRYEWYQNTVNIYFTLLAKGVPKDKAQVDITDRALSISFPLITGSSYDLTLEPLFAAVKPAECITRVMPSKVEIILVKTTPGQKWSNLESSEPVATTNSTDSVGGAANGQGDEAVKRAVFTDATNKATAPAYPTSSRHGPKDWDKITKESSSSSGKPGSLEDDDDYEGGDEANHFFKKLFKGASPEVQKAMMKSYTESNGTALSTNWDEVSKAKVETVPPDGMEARKW